MLPNVENTSGIKDPISIVSHIQTVSKVRILVYRDMPETRHNTKCKARDIQGIKGFCWEAAITHGIKSQTR